MSTYVPTEDGLTWVNTDLIEAVHVDDDELAGWRVLILCATGSHHVYSTLVVDEDHGRRVAAELVGQIMGREQEVPLPVAEPRPPVTFVPPLAPE